VKILIKKKPYISARPLYLWRRIDYGAGVVKEVTTDASTW
jgi:hypothetical protein